MEWFLKVLRDNYANFNGRARRKEFWMYSLFWFVISAILSVLDNMFGLVYTAATPPAGMEQFGDMYKSGYLSTLFTLVTLIPFLAVATRRFHDVGKSGWNLLWYFTCIGILYQLYLWISEGDHGQNEYGADPKGGENEDPFAGQRGENNPFSGQNNPFTNDNNPFRNND